MIFELGIDIIEIYQHTKNEVPSSRYSKVIAQRDYLTFDLDLDPMTLMLKHDLDIMTIYQHIKNEVPSSRYSKVRAQYNYLTLTLTHDVDIRTWPRYYEDISAYQK